VGFDDLERRGLWDLFRDHRSLIESMRHFCQFSFLERPVVKRFGMDHGERDVPEN
jgi:hypothetical protein